MITYQKPYLAEAHLNSLRGGIDDIQILGEFEEDEMRKFVAVYNGVKCKAILNPFNGDFYADDLYEVIKD